MTDDDRLFLEAIEKRCHSERLLGADRFGHRTRYQDYHDGVKLTADELKRIIALTQDKSNELLLVPTSTTWGFGGPAYDVYRAEKVSPHIKADFHLVCSWSKKQMPPKWDFERMKPFFTSGDLVEFYGMDPFSRSEVDYVY